MSDDTARAERAARAQAIQDEITHNNRIDLVRRYIHTPGAWPDGLDLPNWKEPHEIWFTGREDYWIPLAIALQAQMDAEAFMKAKPKEGTSTPRRKPWEKPTDKKPAKSETELRTEVFLKTADRMLKEAAAAKAERIATATNTPDWAAGLNLPATKAGARAAATKKPVTELAEPVTEFQDNPVTPQNPVTVTKKKRGPQASGKALSAAERKRRSRARKKK